jgi:hypothetical protein
MHIITLANKDHFDYLMFVFHKHVTGGGMEPDELAVAAQVWQQLKSAREFDPATLEQPGEREVVKIDGPLSIAHEGNVEIPIDAEKL